MVNKKINDLIQNLPELSGCYSFINNNNQVIYIGKAKNIKKRVQQHFLNPHRLLHNFYPEVEKINFYVTNSEIEALLLEQRLIKKYQPIHNTLWKDDKSYPYIYLTTEEFPRLIYIRNPNTQDKNGLFFGPFPDGFWARKLLNFLNSQLPFRKCDKLPKNSCIFYDLKQCWAPCIHKEIKSKDYYQLKEKLINFFAKKDNNLFKEIDNLIQDSSDNLQFEKAQEYLTLKSKIRSLLSQQLIEIKSKKNFHVLTWTAQSGYLGFTIYFFYSGSFFLKTQELIKIKTDWQTELQFQLTSIYTRNTLPDFFITEEDITNIWFFSNDNYLSKTPKILTPKKGKFKKLLELVKTNNYLFFKTALKLDLKKNNKYQAAINDLKELIKVGQLNHIDFIDTSHQSGLNYVGAVISFKNNNFFWTNFRKYNLEKIIHSSNDPLAIKETLQKKYLYANSDSLIIPDLIIIDGGKQQLNAALEVLKNVNFKVKVISSSKDEKHKTSKLWISPDLPPIFLSSNPVLKNFITLLQDKAHNYAVSFYQKTASFIKKR